MAPVTIVKSVKKALDNTIAEFELLIFNNVMQSNTLVLAKDIKKYLKTEQLRQIYYDNGVLYQVLQRNTKNNSDTVKVRNLFSGVLIEYPTSTLMGFMENGHIMVTNATVRYGNDGKPVFQLRK